MRTGDTVWINGKIPATIARFVAPHKVIVKLGGTMRYTTPISNIEKVGNKLILKSEIFN